MASSSKAGSSSVAASSAPSVEVSSTTLSSLRSLVLLQVSTRLLTFLLTQLLVRLSPPAVFAAAHIHLDLLLSTLLFLSREGFRGALLRPAPSGSWDANKERQRQNVALIPLPVGAVIGIVVGLLYANYAPSGLRSIPTFTSALLLYLTGAALELLSEPLHTRALSKSTSGLDETGQAGMNLRVRAEGAAVLTRCVVTAGFLAWSLNGGAKRDESSMALLAFGVGQAAYGAAVLATYASAFLRTWGVGGTVSLLSPSRAPLAKPGQAAVKATADAGKLLDDHALGLAGAMVRQSFVKHLLTEADKLAVGRLGTLDEQGAYALAGNYGSLVARMLFQPIEESSRLVFARTTSVEQAGTKSDAAKKQASPPAGLSLLYALLSLYILLGLFLATFAPPYATPALLLVAGPRWALQTRAPVLLAAYASAYLPMLALNGVLEAFLQASAPTSTLKAYDGVLMLASATFCIALALAPSLRIERGGADLIFASTISAGVRAAYCARHALKLGEAPRLRPKFATVLLFGAAAVGLNWSAERERRGRGALEMAGPRGIVKGAMGKHVSLGIATLVACLSMCAILEGARIRRAIAALRNSRER